MEKRELMEKEKQFVEEVRVDIGQYRELFNDSYILRKIDDGQMEFVDKLLRDIVDTIVDYVKENGVDDDNIELKDFEIINRSVQVLDMIKKLNYLSPETIDLSKITVATISLFSKFEQLIGGNREIREAVNDLANFFETKEKDRLNLDDVNINESRSKEVSELIENVRSLNREVRYLIDEISRLKAERKSSPTLSEHFLTSIKRELK